MRQSFSESFYITKTKTNENREYLKALIEVAERVLHNQMTSYEQVAECICFIDNEIKNSTEMCYEIVIPFMVKHHLEWETIYKENYFILKKLTYQELDILSRLFENDDRDFVLQGYIIWRVLLSWSLLSMSSQKKVIDDIDAIVTCIDNKDSHIWTPDCEGIFEEEDAISQVILAKWLSVKTKKMFNHQTQHFVHLHEVINKKRMYISMRNSIPNDFAPYRTNIMMRNLFRNAYGINLLEPQVLCEDVDSYITEWALANEENIKSILATVIHYSQSMRENQRRYFEEYDESVNDAILKKGEEKRRIQDQKNTKTYVELLERSCNSYQKTIKQLENSLAAERTKNARELAALRTYIFEQENENERYDLLPEAYSRTDYSRVVIIGGHERWHKKLQQELSGVNILHTDQNIVDLSFVENMDVVVFITGYLSHSMYYRVVEKIESQRVLYINTRNIEYLRKIVDNALIEEF